jgi:hypothetical protein
VLEKILGVYEAKRAGINMLPPYLLVSSVKPHIFNRNYILDTKKLYKGRKVSVK